jgi:hypothetical protein
MATYLPLAKPSPMPVPRASAVLLAVAVPALVAMASAPASATAPAPLAWEAPLEVARAPPLLSAVLVVVALPPLEAVEEPTAREAEGSFVGTGAARRTSLEVHVSREQRKGVNQGSKPACTRRCTPPGVQPHRPRPRPGCGSPLAGAGARRPGLHRVGGQKHVAAEAEVCRLAGLRMPWPQPAHADSPPLTSRASFGASTKLT